MIIILYILIIILSIGSMNYLPRILYGYHPSISIIIMIISLFLLFQIYLPIFIDYFQIKIQIILIIYDFNWLLMIIEFHEYIHNYNNTLSFSSLDIYIDYSVIDQFDIYTFHIWDELIHRIDSLLPAPDQTPKFTQFYIYDSDSIQ
jgi:hypothetical protein